jgi:hypothetical protein
MTSVFDPQHKLVTSPAFAPSILGLLRLLLAVYTTVTAIFVLVWEIVKTHNGDGYFSYFTDLSYIGLSAYFWAAAVQTVVYSRRHDEKHYPLQIWPRPLQFLHLLLYSTIATYPILVTIVFWSLLSSSSTFENPYSAWSNISRHALNTVFALFEILLTNAEPLPWIHLPFLVVMLGGYLGVAYITHATQGFYSYSFLDPAKGRGRLAIYVVGIALAECILFVAVRGVCILRQRLIARRARSDMQQFDLS